ncbi:hypothetical protein SteCoe_36972 [Stentor coeruleus]|uniref:Uncharacterized protein n=1 Tax=Stentor coeruleus TaxID=5963 RepID=A0A1R2APB9_9CILI|nr:hypothetical protein SteCoe_36972 [Stentor coeruleus]
MLSKKERKSSKPDFSSSEIKNFIFPYYVKITKSVKTEDNLSRPQQKSRVSRISFKTNTLFYADLPNNHSEPVIHKYALPSKTLSKSKLVDQNDLTQFDSKMRLIVTRFENKKKPKPEMIVGRKGVMGCKRNSVLIRKLLKAHRRLSLKIG